MSQKREIEAKGQDVEAAIENGLAELGVGRRLSLGQAVKLELQTGGEPVLRDAEIVFISPVVDPASGLRKVKALFDNQDGAVIPGVAGVMVLNDQ